MSNMSDNHETTGYFFSKDLDLQIDTPNYDFEIQLNLN